jgi:FkbM family methyltransferase
MPVSKLHWRLSSAASRLRITARIALRAPFVFANWPYFLVSRFGRQDGVLALRNGLRFYIRPRSSDRSSITEVNILDCYSPVPENSVVVDVGANIGAFALAAAQRARTVYCIEPIASNFGMLTRNIKLNRASNVKPLQVAVAGANGTARMTDCGVKSSLHFDTGGNTEQVRTVTLQTLMEENGIETVDYLKMDCEGAEWDIVLSTPPEILRRIKHIEMEFHNIGSATHPRMLQEHLRKAGFDSTATNGDLFNGLLVASLSPDR